jgi:hypothetical protein
MKKRNIIPVVLSLLVCFSLAAQPGKKAKKDKEGRKQGGGKRMDYPQPTAASPFSFRGMTISLPARNSTV